MKKTTTYLEIAQMLGLTDRRIRQLVDDGKLPGPAAGMPANVQAYCKLLKAARELPTLVEARIAKLNAERELVEMTLAEKRRELVPAKDFLEVAQRGLSAMVAAIQAETALEPEGQNRIIAHLREVGASVTRCAADPTPGDES